SGHYIASLAEVSNNTDPSVDNTTDQKLYALQDQQYNVLALADATGAVVERYEYTLYGKREVHNAQYAVIGQSAYGVRFGFQGLYHDVESRLVYNRTRMLDPVTGRFISRDIRGGLYPDGMNTYVAYHVLLGLLDPFGLMTQEEFDEVQRRLHQINQDPYICVRGGFETVQWGGPSGVGFGETTVEALMESWNDFKGTANIVADFAPGLGNAKGVQEAGTGRNLVTGEVLTAGDRITAVVAIFAGPIAKAGQKIFKGGQWLIKWLRKSDDCPTPKVPGPGTLTPTELDELQKIADKYETQIDVVGSRAAGDGRNIDNLDLPVGKADEGLTRSDIDTRIDTSHPQADEIIEEVNNVGGGAGNASTKHSTVDRPTYDPKIEIKPKKE
ncbi:MAG: pre-toxin TG domain-containing protein, partial [Planctomycetota bacterium]